MNALKMATLAAALAGMLCAAGVRAQSISPARLQHVRTCYMISADLYTGMRQDQRDVDAGRPWGSTFLGTLTAEKDVLAKVRATGDASFYAKVKMHVRISHEAYELLQVAAPNWVPAAGERAQREQATEFSVDMFHKCMGLKAEPDKIGVQRESLRRAQQPRAEVAGRAAYVAALQNAVEQHWMLPDDGSISPGAVCPIEIRQLPGGQVISATALPSCSFNKVGKISVENAVLCASPLPYKGFEKDFEPTVVFDFMPPIAR